jgi:7-keto-8-aminopelargonate synthetase-like enzyme
VKPEIKAELARELALELLQTQSDIGVRTDSDPFHPGFRGKPVVSFACWDLLGVHAHPEVIAAVSKSVAAKGLAASVARVSGGITQALTTCEHRVAQFCGVEAATIFSTRNQCVLTAITAVCGEGVVVLSHSLSCLPLADACALVGAENVEFDSDEHLRKLLPKYGLTKRVVVVLEGASSISGEINALSTLLTSIEHVGGWVFVDETAGLGWHGMRGAGSIEGGLQSPSVVGRLVGFQYGLGIESCALASSYELKELVGYRSRYLRLDAPPSDAAVRAIVVGLDVVELALVQRDKLLVSSAMVQAAVKAQGWRVMSSDHSPILSIWFHSLQKARLVQEALLQRGIFVEALPARSLRKNGAVVRALLSNVHSREEIQQLLAGLDEVFKRTQKPDVPFA